MKTKSTRHIIRQFICWILLIQIVNLSIDPPDRVYINKASNAHTADLTTDEIESIYELLSEGLFDKDVPGNDDTEQEKCLSSFDLFCITFEIGQIVISAFPIQHFQYYQEVFLAHHPERNFPPPKVV